MGGRLRARTFHTSNARTPEANFHTNIDDSLLLILAVDIDMAELTMPKCESCWKESSKLEKCQFCGKSFCEVDYPEHMARERRHEGLAKGEGEFWRQKREGPP